MALAEFLPSSFNPPNGGGLMLFTALKLFSMVRRAERGARSAVCRNTNCRKRPNNRLAVEQLETRMVLSPSGPPFDFSNAFYLANGINPSNIQQRVGTSNSASAFVVENSSPDANHTNIRITETTGGFNHEGNVLYYTINGFVNPNTFLNDAAGQNAMATAEFFTAYIFPKASGNPFSPALSNRRQDNVFDTRNGYSVANPLGLWTAQFVSFTPAAFNTAAGQAALAALAALNGTDLDGTPILKTAMEVDGLVKMGFAVERHRPFDGSQGFPWII
jgi:hypothetical protein